jgi:phosphoglycerol transferase
MFAQSSGLPLKLPIGYENMMGISESFFATTTCLGDILDENGYNQALMVGSNSYFGGRNQYYTAHGNQTIYDLYSAKADGIIDDDYYQNYWGMSDVDLYEYAKQVLGELSADDEPFAFTFLTVDTHFPSGFPCEECVEFKKDSNGDYLLDSNGYRRPSHLNYDPSNQYCNVFRCASKQIYEFVEWLKVQDYFEDTTIVIAGDHLTMDSGFSNRIPDTYTRTPVNLIINSSVSPYNSKNREFATVDMFPTTLAAMGVSIEGDRLGLGTNLFSNRKTLVEEMGLEAYEDALLQKSNFYNSLLFEQ